MEGEIMSKMGDFVIACGEEYERRHPGCGWDKAMEVITSDDPESREIESYILKTQYGIEED
jgi:hypothetical protein